MDSILNNILFLDTSIMKFLNIQLSNQLFDLIMPLFDKPIFFIIPLILFWIYSIFKRQNFKWKIALLIPIGILLTDQTGAIIKRMELRSRPWTVHTDINHLGGKGGKLYSFPSNHAANSTFLAIAFSVFYPKLKWFFLLSAGLVGFSRIYIGVHYPSDVIAGSLLGIIFASTLLKVWNYYKK